MKPEDRQRLLSRIGEALTSTIYALEGDADEQASPFTMGSTLAEAAIATIEQSGFEVVRKR